MPYVLLMLSLLQTAPAPTSSASLSRQSVTPTTLAGRAKQYHQDYLARLQAVFFAPGDPRATFLLSTATEELSARRRALRAELQASGAALGTVAPPPAWTQELAELHKTPQAIKFVDRCRRNAALETVYQRFVDARLDELLPAPAQPR